MSDPKLILLTNDDGIQSPGLWAAAGALEILGQVVVAAPVAQSTALGRSLPAHSEGRIHEQTFTINGRLCQGYGVEGSPAQVVQHALLEILPRRPDLVVAGINYGENVGGGVTISGTIGAALEAASFGVPALAVSLETDKQYHNSHSTDVDFSTAAFFTHQFAQALLGLSFPADVDVIKVEVPEAATPQTPWRVTRLSRAQYYELLKPQRAQLHDQARMDYRRSIDYERVEPDSDIRALLDHVVSVTPLSLDLTARVDFREMSRWLGRGETHE